MRRCESASFAGARSAWIVERWAGGILRTTDAGETWTRLPTDEVGAVSLVSFRDERSGWAIGRDGRLWRSTDAGDSWEFVRGPLEPSGWAKLGEYTLHFETDARGWALADQGLFETRDGGVNWTRVVPEVSGRRYPWIVRLSVEGRTIGLVALDHQILVSRDDGGTWTAAAVPAEDSKYSLTPWIGGDGQIVLLADSGTRLIRSTDSGRTWASHEVTLEKGDKHAIHFQDEAVGWIAGRSADFGRPIEGVLWRTGDGGRSWHPDRFAADEWILDDVRFVSRLEGWVLGDRKLYRTNNGGETWRTVLEFTPYSEDSGSEARRAEGEQ